MNRTIPTTLLALALAACGGKPTAEAAPADGAPPTPAPAPAAARVPALTYFTMTG